jgi:hypothetical protein
MMCSPSEYERVLPMTSNDAAINLQKTREDKKFFYFFFKHGGEFGKHLGMILIWIFQLLIL